MGCRQEDRGNLILSNSLNPNYQDSRGIQHVWPCHAGSLPMKRVRTFILAPDISVLLCPTMGPISAASVSATGWFCPQIWWQEQGVQAKWPHRGDPQISPDFSSFHIPAPGGSRDVLLASHGKCPAHVWSMGIVMARFTDAQRNWGAGGSYSEGYGSPETQAPAQHFGR